MSLLSAASSALVTAVSGGYAAAQATSGGFDYTGLAALITAVSGMVATIGALILGLRRKDTDVAAIIKALEESKREMNGGSPPAGGSEP